MIRVIFWACLALSPDDCRRVEIAAGSPLLTPAVSCRAEPLVAVARWAQSHPGWTVHAPVCRPSTPLGT